MALIYLLCLIACHSGAALMSPISPLVVCSCAAMPQVIDLFGGHGPEDQSLDSPTGAMLLVVFLVPITLLFHGDVSDSGQRIQLLKNLAIIGGLLLVADQESRS